MSGKTQRKMERCWPTCCCWWFADYGTPWCFRQTSGVGNARKGLLIGSTLTRVWSGLLWTRWIRTSAAGIKRLPVLRACHALNVCTHSLLADVLMFSNTPAFTAWVLMRTMDIKCTVGICSVLAWSDKMKLHPDPNPNLLHCSARAAVLLKPQSFLSKLVKFQQTTLYLE